MIVVNTDFIPGKKIIKSLGIVKGNTIRARHIGKDILAVLKNIVGGEIEEYTKASLRWANPANRLSTGWSRKPGSSAPMR